MHKLRFTRPKLEPATLRDPFPRHAKLHLPFHWLRALDADDDIGELLLLKCLR